MISENAPIHLMAIRLARQLRLLVEAPFGKEEREAMEFAFYKLIREGLEEFRARKDG